jgi:hypothetical protein
MEQGFGARRKVACAQWSAAGEEDEERMANKGIVGGLAVPLPDSMRTRE